MAYRSIVIVGSPRSDGPPPRASAARCAGAVLRLPYGHTDRTCHFRVRTGGRVRLADLPRAGGFLPSSRAPYCWIMKIGVREWN